MLHRLLATALTSACLLISASAQAKDLTLLSSWDDNYNAVPVFVGQFVEKLKEKSNGDLSVQVRGPETVPPFEQLQPVAGGLFDMLFTHGAYHLGETGMAFGLDAVKDDPIARRESGIYELIDKHYQSRGLKLIGVFSSASGYHFLLRQPIAEDGALKGRKIRASATYHDMVQELQGAVVTLPPSEIYSSLERGVVDGAAWPVFGAMEYRWYEVSDYMTRPTFGVTNQVMLMNLDTWNGLSKQQQDTIMEVARELEVSGRQVFADLWAKEDAAMQEAGLEITQFGPNVAPKVDAMFAEGVWKQVRNRAGADGEAFHKLAVEKGLTSQ
ncbi:TRAP transporter substrate-binding protein DctP [Neopusillimonas maritima]|uniref:C4-dicarboxylate ABC transporter substrate-binding protein n=1 Tax=Neopusillimonas maritima TaxID=2026239 RepID=A0A3A1YWK6_9BURK|nr:TRAP transporter substrate-binding protein DctP [Neopusillimonas maritima]RIY41230.1 C4-dicarboxylate ABC transporter substrate-binding protein [Neopusillimonas maritima]